MDLRALALLLALGCAGGRGKAGDGSGSGSGTATGTGSAPVTAAPAGDAEIRVEWKDAPAAIRTSPGRNPCGAPRRARAKVHTLWGVANAVVIVDVPGAAPAAMVRITDCAVEPPLVTTAPGTFRIYNADTRRHVVGITEGAPLDADAPTKLGKTPRAVLPWLGHEVEAPIAAGATAVAPVESPEDLAWIVATPHQATITDDTGLASFAALPPGTHKITAWLPPAASGKAKLVTGDLTITVGETTKLTIDLAANTISPTPLPTKLLQPPNMPLSGSGAAPDPDP